MINTGMMSSNTGEWSTPQWFFDQLDAEFHFTLDVCATAENAKCKKFFTKETDGLAQKWSGTCFLQPPYGRELGKWVKKAHSEWIKGVKIVGLLPARTDTKWFHDYIYNKHILRRNDEYDYVELRFIKGRLKFGDSKNSAPFPSVVVVWHSDWGM